MKAATFLLMACLGVIGAAHGFAMDAVGTSPEGTGEVSSEPATEGSAGAAQRVDLESRPDADQGRPPILMAFNQMAASNSCSAPAYQSCPPCQVSCPSNMIAFCAPGSGYQTMGPGGIWTYQCWVSPQCFCKNP